jgi:hypothetical protein
MIATALCVPPEEIYHRDVLSLDEGRLNAIKVHISLSVIVNGQYAAILFCTIAAPRSGFRGGAKLPPAHAVRIVWIVRFPRPEVNCHKHESRVDPAGCGYQKKPALNSSGIRTVSADRDETGWS